MEIGDEFENKSSDCVKCYVFMVRNIRSAKQQIEATLDTINVAFENLLDKLFTDEVLDVSSDITVLETMLKQEGLTGSEFEPKQ